MLDTSQLPLSTSQMIEFFSQLPPIHTYTSMNETRKHIILTLICICMYKQKKIQLAASQELAKQGIGMLDFHYRHET